jgi:hypothetical protein
MLIGPDNNVLVFEKITAVRDGKFNSFIETKNISSMVSGTYELVILHDNAAYSDTFAFTSNITVPAAVPVTVPAPVPVPVPAPAPVPVPAAVPVPVPAIVSETTPVEAVTESEGGGCLIATAAYGSEMSPQVQMLREIRDNQLMNTESGTAFMSGFNELYYSFSPTIADMERENPMFKEVVKVGLTPMLSSLSLMENAESESEVLGIGISVILLNIGMYLGVPAIVIIGIRKIK